MRLNFLLALLLVGLVAPGASADVYLYYTETFTGASGSLDGDVNFTGQTVTLTMLGDASNVGSGTYNSNTEYTLAGTITVSVSGGPTDQLNSTDTLGVFDNQAPTASASSAGFADFSNYNVIMATSGTFFSSYKLAQATDQQSGTGYELPPGGFLIPTLNDGNGGTFIITSASGSYFQALVVPEPSSIVMTGLAMVLGGAGCVRRRHLAQARRSRAT